MPLQAKAVRSGAWWNRSISRLLFGLPSRVVPAPRKGAAGALVVYRHRVYYQDLIEG
jgi:hypothetical protein